VLYFSEFRPTDAVWFDRFVKGRIYYGAPSLHSACRACRRGYRSSRRKGTSDPGSAATPAQWARGPVAGRDNPIESHRALRGLNLSQRGRFVVISC